MTGGQLILLTLLSGLELVVLLAGVLRLRGILDESAQLYVQAINAAPSESAGEWFNLGLVLAERNDPGGARNAYGRANALDPTDLRALFGEQLTLPMVYADAKEVDAARAGFQRNSWPPSAPTYTSAAVAPVSPSGFIR